MPQAEVSVSTRDMWEDEKIRNNLDHYMSTEPANAMLRARLRRYTCADVVNDLKLFMRCHPTPANEPRYWKIDGAGSLAEQLKYKAFVEYPIFYVALPSEVEQYKVA